jgi:hypothetical protein
VADWPDALLYRDTELLQELVKTGNLDFPDIVSVMVK